MSRRLFKLASTTGALLTFTLHEPFLVVSGPLVDLLFRPQTFLFPRSLPALTQDCLLDIDS
jgi:hypothetical protein